MLLSCVSINPFSVVLDIEYGVVFGKSVTCVPGIYWCVSKTVCCVLQIYASVLLNFVCKERKFKHFRILGTTGKFVFARISR